MRTIILDEPGSFRLIETDPPGRPAEDEALVRVRRVGICGTDLHAFRGRQPFFSYPRILGHELAVEVVALGPQSHPVSIAPGDICAVEPYLNCGTCQSCRRGLTNCCENLQVLGVHSDGGMREEIIVPADKLHKADGVSVDSLALVEMLCIGAHAVRRAELAPEERVLVIGAGPIGLSTIQFARLAGADVCLLEVSETRMAFCRDQLGVDKVVVDARGDAIAELRVHFGGDLPTVVFDATGNVNSMTRAFDYVAHGGKLIYVGLVQDDITFHDPDFHRRELMILASRNAASQDFRNVIDALQSGAVDLDPWITHRASPESLIDEFPGWLQPENGVVKAMLTF